MARPGKWNMIVPGPKPDELISSVDNPAINPGKFTQLYDGIFASCLHYKGLTTEA